MIQPQQVKETLAPLAGTDGKPAKEGFLYDCTDEKAIGELKPFACDLSQTTARVFAALPRAIKGVAVSATQSVKAGDDLAVAVEFQDAKGERLVGVLPFHLTIRRPDGTAHAEFYRSTTKEGAFSIVLPTAAMILSESGPSRCDPSSRANSPRCRWRLARLRRRHMQPP